MKKIIIYLLLISFVVSLTSCNDGNKFKVVSSDDYNKELFYQNDLDTIGADPSVIYISEGEQEGYYYMYITSDEIEVSGYLAYRSKDLVDWECMGTALTSYKEKDENGNTYIGFGINEYWAPEVIYDKNTMLYYMFYTANSYDTPKNVEYYFFGDIAVSDKPEGPFIPYNKYFDNEPVLIDEKKKTYLYEPMFDFRKMDNDDPLYETRTDGYMKVIDFSPFVDPETGKKYAYFTRDLYPEKQIVSSKIYVIGLDDDFKPKYDDVHLLTVPNKIRVDDKTQSQSLSEGKVNEGAFCVYHNGKYYLLYSVCSYMLKAYAVHMAVADSPTGPFTKLLPEEGGELLFVDGKTTWLGGTGHCSVVSRNGHDYICYHSHQCRFNPFFNRAVAMDEINWIDNGKGLEIMVANGPSWALLPKTTEGKNSISSFVTITSDNNKTDVKFLNDNIILFHDFPYENETIFNKGKTKINIDLFNYQKVEAIAIYNSFYEDLMINEIDNIKITTESETIKTGKLMFDKDRYTNEKGVIIPGGSFTIELFDQKVKKIEITINSDKEFALSEIVIMGELSN
ncbi:MAG: family 43 glycosylhydrolase [Erysipelotrichaceae bacterium]|nr:family 43 glycosylhydrolase [Erysipelotrichaceae bacterium]